MTSPAKAKRAKAHPATSMIKGRASISSVKATRESPLVRVTALFGAPTFFSQDGGLTLPRTLCYYNVAQWMAEWLLLLPSKRSISSFILCARAHVTDCATMNGSW